MRMFTAIAFVLMSQGLAAQTASPPTANGTQGNTGVLRLSAFEGSWRMLDDGSGQSVTETCGWLEGGKRHMVCRTTLTGGGRRSQNEVVMNYRGRDSTYTVNSFIGSGPLMTYLGKFDGERWVLDYQGQPGATQRLRMLIQAGTDTIHFMEESSEYGGAWRITEDYRYARIKQ
jgi:hypothetical protein